MIVALSGTHNLESTEPRPSDTATDRSSTLLNFRWACAEVIRDEQEAEDGSRSVRYSKGSCHNPLPPQWWSNSTSRRRCRWTGTEAFGQML